MEFFPHQQADEAATVAIPSLEKLYEISPFLPPVGQKFSLVERAEDLEETPESLLAILNCLKVLGGIEYTQDGDEFTLTLRETIGKLSAPNYKQAFGASNPAIEATDERPENITEMYGLIVDTFKYLPEPKGTVLLEQIASDLEESSEKILFAMNDLQRNKMLNFTHESGTITVLYKNERFARENWVLEGTEQ